MKTLTTNEMLELTQRPIGDYDETATVHAELRDALPAYLAAQPDLERVVEVACEMQRAADAEVAKASGGLVAAGMLHRNQLMRDVLNAPLPSLDSVLARVKEMGNDG